MSQSLFVLYEQIGPRDPFGQIMQDHFCKINSRLHSIQQYPDAAAQRGRFLEQASMQTLYCWQQWQLNTGAVVLRQFFVMAGVLMSLSASAQGWDDCVCLDLNAFYLDLVSEEERSRVQNLEPFDEHEVRNLHKHWMHVLYPTRLCELDSKSVTNTQRNMSSRLFDSKCRKQQMFDFFCVITVVMTWNILPSPPSFLRTGTRNVPIISSSLRLGAH